MRRLLAATVAVALLCGPPAARADLPVIDAAQLARWVTQAQQMANQLVQLETEVRQLADVPQNLITQVEQLMAQGVQNPLQNIMTNLNAMMTGQGIGNCTGGQNILTQNQYAPATGGDFQASLLNSTANRNAGLQACTQQMLAATQTRLANLPPLLAQLQGATDVTQATAISGRIQAEIANITAGQQQIIALSQTAQLQQLMAEQQQLQKMRADAQERANATGGGAPGVAAPAIQAPAPFQAAGN